MDSPFIDLPGWTSLPPAASLCRDVEFYGLSFPADRDALQDFLDRSYNVVAGRTQFRVLLGRVFLTIVRAKKIGGVEPPYSTEGTTAETDIGFWMLVGSFAEGALLPHAVTAVPAYLFVDNGYAAAGGREIWGYPKVTATITAPAEMRSAGPFNVSALAFQSFGQDAQTSLQKVLSLQGGAMDFDQTTGSAGDIFRLLCGGADAGPLDFVFNIPPLLDFIGGGVGSIFPVLLLKQFRAADNPTTACYQALMEGPLALTELRSVGVLVGNWQLELHALDSLAFIRMLGLGVPQGGTLVLQTGVALWADVDFKIGYARPAT
jgi:hypothetical protein